MRPHEGSVLFALPLIQVDEFRAAVVADRYTPRHHEAHRLFGLTSEMVWIQPRPPYMVVRWEGEGALAAVGQLGTSRDPFWARWRGSLRVFVGALAMESFWRPGALSHAFTWDSGEVGAQRLVRVDRAPGGSSPLPQSLDPDQDPGMVKEYERLGRGHGITRTEIWRQTFADHEVVVQMVEGHDLDAALAGIERGDHGLDGRLTAMTRSVLDEGHAIRSDTELLVDWRA